jgi:betaine lipid synthase
MASAGGNIFHRDLSRLSLSFFPHLHSHSQLIAGIAGITLIAGLSQLLASKPTTLARNNDEEEPGLLRSLLLFAWNCFVKPHAEDGNGQQGHLESFYANQAGIYDRTRKGLLKGREDMLGLVAAQLGAKQDKAERKRIWVDVCSLLRLC